MLKQEPTTTTIRAGEIVVEEVYLMNLGDDLATLMIECRSKYPQIGVAAACLDLYAGIGTMHKDYDKLGTSTRVEFDEFPCPPWEIFSAVAGRYDVRVTLTKNPEIVS